MTAEIGWPVRSTVLVTAAPVQRPRLCHVPDVLRATTVTPQEWGRAQARFDRLDARLGDLTSEVLDLRRETAARAGRLSHELGARMDRFEQTVTARIDSRLDGVNHRFDSFQTALNSRFDAQTAAFNELLIAVVGAGQILGR